MTPLRVNRRRFLGCSAAASLALAQGAPVEAGSSRPVRLALVGLGNRGTALLRGLLELPEATVVAVVDAEPRHIQRAQGIVQKTGRPRPEAPGTIAAALERADVDAVVTALPCDLHRATSQAIIESGRHLYAEKPLGLDLADCDALLATAAAHPRVAFHVGLQRRSHPRYAEAAALIQQGGLGSLVEGRLSWTSSNGPISGHQGWLGRRDRSGDWMIEQGVHIWDLLHWMTNALPVRAYGHGRRDVFRAEHPERDVTDHYRVVLEWADGFHASFVQSWIDPADDAFTGTDQRLLGTAGGLDLSTGVATFRDRSRPRLTLHPGPVHDTRLALEAFLAAARAEDTLPPPPVTLQEARDANVTALMVRTAVDERRVVARAEVDPLA